MSTVCMEVCACAYMYSGVRVSVHVCMYMCIVFMGVVWMCVHECVSVSASVFTCMSCTCGCKELTNFSACESNKVRHREQLGF